MIPQTWLLRCCCAMAAHMLGLWLQDKVVVVPGDLHKPGLGLSAEDEERITNEVQFVVHSAASISFFEHIHTLLEQNYEVGAPLHRVHYRPQTNASHLVVPREDAFCAPVTLTYLLLKALKPKCCLLLTLQALWRAPSAGLPASDAEPSPDPCRPRRRWRSWR